MATEILVRISKSDVEELSLANDDPTEINSYTIPSNTYEIADGAFSSLYNVETIHIPESVTLIRDRSFQGIHHIPTETYSELQSVHFEGNDPKCLSIGELAFAHHMRLKKFAIPKNLETLGNFALMKTGIERLIIPYSLKNISRGSFYDMQDLKYILFLDNEKHIHEQYNSKNKKKYNTLKKQQRERLQNHKNNLDVYLEGYNNMNTPAHLNSNPFVIFPGDTIGSKSEAVDLRGFDFSSVVFPKLYFKNVIMDETTYFTNADMTNITYHPDVDKEFVKANVHNALTLPPILQKRLQSTINESMENSLPKYLIDIIAEKSNVKSTRKKGNKSNRKTKKQKRKSKDK